ncbi:AAA family ATPase [Bacillus firmus]|uniref:AAA family ATPase n=1 Tax=Cytobacillus firmus TaxID=1399 RepID=UPI00157FE714|nr:AAA family ATPase [Cytobacillus firmus]NUH86249.1 AAA family ATPase [Cytobacillus firmus]
MSKYIISRIFLKNFKSIDEAVIELEGENLNVLDGPNGFGKTTIYDAIQLLLTGTVRRIESNKIVTSTRGFDDHLFSKNQKLQTTIRVEFIDRLDEDNKLILQRELAPPSDLSGSQKKPQNFSEFKVSMLDSFEDEDDSDKNKKEIADSDLNELLGVQDLREKFNLYHYIEQEESTYLFKQNEKERMKVISKLFNIEDETNQKEFIETVRKKLISYKGTLTKELEKLESQLKKEGQTDIKEFQYKPLISENQLNNVIWDREIIQPIDSELKEKYLEELDTIRNLVLYKEDFKRELGNERLDRIIQNEEKLKATIVLGHFHETLDKLEKQYQSQEKLKVIHNLLKTKDIIHKNIDWIFLDGNLELPFEIDNVIDRINLIKNYMANSNAISSIVTQMIQTRSNLEMDFRKFLENNPEAENYCPLCGDTKDSFEELIDQINRKSMELKGSLDSSAQKLTEELEKLYEDYLNILTQAIEISLNASPIDESFINQLKKYKNVVTDMNKALEWFNENGVNINSYINKNVHLVEDLNQKVQLLKEELQNKKEQVGEFCRDNMKLLKDIFNSRLNRNSDLLNKINLDSIQQKKDYIEYQFILQSSVTFQKAKSLRKRQEKLESVLKSINRIIGIYNEKINKHRAKMISDIEIPFYIYSGKIIQNHQRGIGVFIKEEREMSETGEVQLKLINFVPPVPTDHDIVHSFSSGQLSSTVIAFTLALNKVYGNSGIMTLLIDDPVQTMDEMNMASFVELLRNDFSDRQLILSTHEDDISLYIRYKFLKYGLSVGNINVKQTLYAR